MRNIIKYSLLVFSLIVAVSCYKSDANYEYDTRRELAIEDFEDSYNLVTNSDTLKIAPVVKIGNENDDITYTWTKHAYLVGSNDIPAVIPTDTLSREKNLEYVILDEPNNYTVILEIKNNTTGQITYAYTKLAVRNKYSLGFYILKEVDGDSDIDLYYDDETMYHDLLFTERGSRVEGSPSWLTLFPSFKSIEIADGAAVEKVENAVTIVTDKDLEVISLNDLDKLMDHSNIYTAGPVDETPLYFTSYDGGYYGTSSLLMSTTNVGFAYYCGVGQMYSAPPAFAYELADKMAVSGYDNFVFDKLNGNFMHHSQMTIKTFTDISEGQLPSDAPSNPYSPNGIDDELLFIGRTTIGYDDPVCYAIFQDATDANKRLFYNLDFYTMVENPYYYPGYNDEFIKGVTDNNPIESVTEITGMKMNEATCFAANETSAKAVYYSVDDELYIYTPDNNQEAEVNLNGFPTGEEITFIYHYYWYCDSLEENILDLLAVGTQVGDNYSIYMYELVGSTPVGEPVKTVKGHGKLKRIQFSSPTMTGSAYYSYPRGMN